jgi:DNA ligase-associated metallophosphoesterase
MTPAPLHLGPERFMLDPLGALFWPAQGALIVADLHLEKGSAAAMRGSLVPPWDTHATLEKLAALLRRWSPRQVVALGDSFHDRHGSTRLMQADAARLAGMTAQVPFTWVLGNHDPAPQAGIAGTVAEEWHAAGIAFRHQALPAASGEVSGHFHPKATVQTRGGALTRPCFMTDAGRIVLPPLGAYTGGLDVRNPALARLFPRGGRAFLLGRDRLFSFPVAPGR